MAEFISSDVQTVKTNQNILFTQTPINGGNCITHRQGSGLFTLRGLTSTQCRARFKITFGANIAIAAAGTETPISVAVAINGEPINSSTMIVTPAAVSEFFNVSRSLFIDVPAGCCIQVSIQNTSAQSIDVENANLLIERIA